MPVTTTNMSLVLPDVGSTIGTTWATYLNTAFSTVDSHDHSTGKGTKITPAGINISSDLTFNTTNNATQVRSVRLANTTFSASGSDLACIYAQGNELYYRDGAGNTVQITSGGSVNASALASLTIKDAALTLQYTGDTSRQARFNVANVPSSTTVTYTMPGVSDTIPGISGSNTFTGSNTFSQNQVFQNGTTFSQISTPANPSAGSLKLYPKSNGNFYTLNSSGAEVQIGSGSGGGSLYSATTFEDGAVDGVALYLNTPASTPTTGTGGSPVTTFAASSSSPLRGTYSGLYTKDAANRQGEGFALPITLQSVDTGKTIQVSFDWSVASGTFVSGDMVFYVYDVTNSVLITPSQTTLPTGTSSQYSVAFQATTSTSYRLIWHVASTSASAYSIKIDQIQINPIIRPVVAGISDWKVSSVTYSAGFGTVTNNVCEERREGDSIVFRGSLTSTSPAASTASVTIPYTIDTTKLSIPANTSAQDGNTVGTWTGNVVGVSNAGYVLTAPGTSTTTLYFSRQLLDSASHLTPSSSTSTQVTSGGVFAWEARIPVANLSSNITLASTSGAIDYQSNSSSTDADDTTSFVAGATGSVGILNTTALTASRRKRVQFSTPIQPTDRIVIEFSSANGAAPWTPAIGYDTGVTGYQVTSYYNYGAAGTQTQGIGYKPVTGSTTQLDITFGTLMQNGGGAANWNANFPTGTRWRVAKYSSIGGAELAPATITSQGTVAMSQWSNSGITTSNFSAGFGTATNIEVFYKRVGDTLVIRGRAKAGTVAASQGCFILPTINGAQLNIDTTKVGTSLTSSLGGSQRISSGGGVSMNTLGYSLAWAYNSGQGTDRIQLVTNVGAAIYSDNNANSILANTDGFDFWNVHVPISGWN